MHEFSIPFTVTECSDCEAERPVAGTCPSCGSVSEDVDPSVEPRAEAVMLVESIVSGGCSGAEVPDRLDDAWTFLSDWIGAFFSSLQALVEEPSEEARAAALGERIAEIKVLREQLDSTPRLRPETAVSRVLIQIIGALERVSASYLRVLAAATPEEAQRESDLAQEALDEAGVLAARVSTLIQRRERFVGERVPDVLAGLATDSFSDVQASNLLDFESAGGWLFERISDGEPCPNGLGVSLNLVWAYVEANLDPDRFLDCATSTFSHLVSSASIDGLIANEDWRQKMSEASREMFDSAMELDHSLAGAEGIERLEYRATIRLGAVLVERVAQAFLATLMTVDLRRDWRSMANRDLNALHQMADNAGFGSLLVGLDMALRDADAHGQYQLVERGVEFMSNRAEYSSLTEDELVDRVLAASESCLAMHTAITCVLALRGVPIEELDESLLHMTDEQQVALVMGINGVSVDHVELGDDGRLIIDGSASILIHKPLTLLASLHPHLPEGVVALRVRIRDPELTVIVEGPVGLFDAWRDAPEGIEKECRTVEVMHAFRVNGRRVATKQHLRKWAAVKALGAASTGQAASSLRVLRELAERLNDAKLERHVRSLLRVVEAGEGHEPTPVHDPRSSDELTRWASLRLVGPTQDPHSAVR